VPFWQRERGGHQPKGEVVSSGVGAGDGDGDARFIERLSFAPGDGRAISDRRPHGSNEARVGVERDVGGGVSKGDHRTTELVALEKTYVFLMGGPAFEGAVRQSGASRRITKGSSQERDGVGVNRDRVTQLLARHQTEVFDGHALGIAAYGRDVDNGSERSFHIRFCGHRCDAQESSDGKLAKRAET
jgi:hypothetical protein